MAPIQNNDGWRITSFKAKKGLVVFTVSDEEWCSKCRAQARRQSVKTEGSWVLTIQFCRCGKLMQFSDRLLEYTLKVRSIDHSQSVLQRFIAEYRTSPDFVELLAPLLPMISERCEPQSFFKQNSVVSVVCQRSNFASPPHHLLWNNSIPQKVTAKFI